MAETPGIKDAARCLGANEGGREEEENCLRIACRSSDRLHGAKTDDRLIENAVVIMPVVGLVLLSRPSSFFSCFFRCESALAVIVCITSVEV